MLVIRLGAVFALGLWIACGAEPPAAVLDQPINDERPEEEEPIDDKPVEEEPTPAPEPEPEPEPNSCGNAVVDDDELCDGAGPAELRCEHLSFGAGSVGCASSCDGVDVSGCGALTTTAIPVRGEDLALSGSLDQTDAQWARPNASCVAGTTMDRHFDTYAIVNSSGEVETVRVTAAWGEGNDGFLHFFAPGADLREITGCIAGNDDFESTTGSRVEIALQPGQRVNVIASSYTADTPFGAYELALRTLSEDEITPVDPVDPIDPVDPTPDAPRLAIGLPGETLVVDGNINNTDPSVVAPDAACAAGTLVVNYELLTLVNETGSAQRVLVDGNAEQAADLIVYDAFNPAAPQVGCVVVTDALEMPAGAEFTLAVASATETPAGVWTLSVETLASPIDVESLPVAGIGGAVIIKDTLDGAPTWSRVTQSCEQTALGGQGYRVHRITNDTHNHKHLDITAAWGGDGILAVFEADFLVGAPEQSCLFANDDWSANAMEGSSTFGSHLSDVRIEAGETLVVVASAFSAAAPAFEYTLEIETSDHGDEVVHVMATDNGTIELKGMVHVAGSVMVEESGTERLYSAHLMRNHGNHEHGLELLATWAEGKDGMLRVYAFDGAAPGGLGEMLASNDDFEGTAQSRISAEELRIMDDRLFVVVATGFSAQNAIGGYTLTATTAD